VIQHPIRMCWTFAGVLGLFATSLAAEPPAKSREFLFTYKATVTGLEPGKTARIWLPAAQSNDDQQVTIVKQEAPAEGQVNKEPKYGNLIYYLEAKAGQDGVVNVALTFRVKRNEVKGDALSKVDQREIEQFLKPDAKVPVGGKALALIEGRQQPSDQLELGKFLYDTVNDHMMYSKDKPGWGFGDSDWACDSKFGNCTDFHSLFISLARAKKMPAKFEMGFSVPEKHGSGGIAGYHCWAKFKPEGHGWIPVDISEANKVKTSKPEMVKYYFGNLTEDRVAFTVGRDLTLVPKQDGPAINFLIYPYVEVDGKRYAAEKVKRAFSYQDVEAK
jgi:transglutaminase-like putative cysteine protease